MVGFLTLDLACNEADAAAIMAAIAPADTAALEALLPDRWLAAHPEHRLEQREVKLRPVAATSEPLVGWPPRNRQW